MARTRTQDAAAKSNAKAAAERRPSDEKRSILMKHQARKGAHVQWNPRVAVKGDSSQALNDAAAHAEANYGRNVIQQQQPRDMARKAPTRTYRTMGDVQSPEADAATSVRPAALTPAIVSPAAGAPAPEGRRLGSPGFQQSRRIFARPSASEETSMPVISPANPGREPRSSLLQPITARGSKRRRNSSSAFYQPESKRPCFHYDAREDLLRTLPQQPRVLQPAEIGALFMELREHLRDWSFRVFRFRLSATERRHWPMHELMTRFYPLFLTTRYIADGSQYGWRNFFTTPESRASLVYGVIGEYLREHVFNMPAFGLPPEVAKQIEDVDHEYLHYDAHVRSRHRALILQQALQDFDCIDARREASENLAATLIEILTPLLPPHVFFFNPDTQQFELSTGKEAQEYLASFRSRLARFIDIACTLRWCMTLTGHDGSIVRMAAPPQKGEKWYGDFDAPRDCVNKNMIYQTQSHGLVFGKRQREEEQVLKFPDGTADATGDESLPYRPLIKMTCFPRVEMVVPRGLDKEQLEDRNENGVVGEWRPIVPDMVRKSYEKDKGRWVSEDGEMRMAYIDRYDILSHHDVYLEHNFVEQSREQFIRQYYRQLKAQGKSSKSDGNGDEGNDDSSSVSSDSSTATDISNLSFEGLKDYDMRNSKQATQAWYRYTEKRRAAMKVRDKQCGWEYDLPQRLDRRETLEEAVADAEDLHGPTKRFHLSSHSIKEHLHSQARRIWNAIAPQGTNIENAAVLFATAALICYYKGYTLPSWLTDTVQNAHNITLSHVNLQLHSLWSQLHALPDLSTLNPAHIFHHSHDRLRSLLPHVKDTPQRTFIDNERHSLTTTGLPRNWSANLHTLWASTAEQLKSSMQEAKSASKNVIGGGGGRGAGTGNGMSAVTTPLTTAVLTTTTAVLTGTTTVSAPPLGGVVPGEGKAVGGKGKEKGGSGGIEKGKTKTSTKTSAKTKVKVNPASTSTKTETKTSTKMEKGKVTQTPTKGAVKGKLEETGKAKTGFGYWMGFGN